MNLEALKTNLRQHSTKNIRFVLPDRDLIPREAHITEVGHVAKHFIDCGGTVRSQESCLLQAWVSDADPTHRLSSEKLAGILEQSAKVVPSDDLDVEVEYGACAVSQYTIESAEVLEGELTFQLANKHTDCLAREACGIADEANGCGCGSDEGKCC